VRFLLPLLLATSMLPSACCGNVCTFHRHFGNASIRCTGVHHAVAGSVKRLPRAHADCVGCHPWRAPGRGQPGRGSGTVPVLPATRRPDGIEKH